MALIGSISAFSFVGATPTLACNVQSGTFQYNWIGGEENVSSVQGVKAKLDSYNPSPIFQTTSFWVMLQNGANKYAQVGWIKTSSDSSEHVYLEFTDDSGNWYRYYYYATGDYWTSTPYTVPSGSNTYSVTYDSSSGNFTMQYSTGKAYSVSYTWVPGLIDVDGETSNYGSGSPNKGDHMPGDTSTKIQAQQIQKKVSGSWTDASLTYRSPEGNGDYDNSVTTTPGFRIWDVRCSD